MKKNIKMVSMFLFGIISIFAMGFTDVKASTLVQDPIDNVYYTRRGGGQSYLSAKYYTYTMDNKVVYCIEPGVNITTNIYAGAEGWVNSPYSKEVNQKIQLIGYYGYDYPTHQTIRYRMAAQSLIWETVGGQIVEFWTEQYGNGDYINLDYEKGQIMNLVNAHYNVPSFNGQSITGVIGQTSTFTDSSGVLSNYEIVQSDNAISSISNNTLSVTPNTVGDINVILQRRTYNNDPSVVFVGIDNQSQKMGYFRVNDPIRSAVSITSLGGKVSIEKIDVDNMNTIPKGDAKLNNAVYGIYNELGVRIGEITTNELAIGTSEYLPSLGIFYLQEEQNSLGYTLDTTKYYFGITANDLNPKVKVHEKVIERYIELFKVYANGNTAILTAEPNITFEFYLKSNNQLYERATTNNDGKINIKLPYGTYVVKQINSSYNYEKVEDFEIVIDNNNKEPIYKLISNAEVTAKLKVVKVDKDTGNIIEKSGIKFKIKNTDTNKYVCQTVTYPTATTLCEFATDSNGILITPYPLFTGHYQLEEIDQSIDGYLWNNESKSFEIGEDSNFITDKDYGILFEIKFNNKEVKGKIELNKIGEKVVIANGTYNYEKIKLSEVVYELYANENIYSANGILMYEKDTLVGQLTTNTDGYASINELYLGKYYLIEKSSSKNNLVDSTKHFVELKYKNQYTAIITEKLDLENYLPKSDLEFTKTDLITGDTIPNTKIEVYTESNELIFSGVTNEKGKIIISNLFVGKFYVIETESATGYVISEEKVFFEILEDGQIVKAEMSNKPIFGILEFTKIDLSTSEPLPNTKIEIYSDKDELIFSGTTNEEGKIIVEKLRYGKYYIIEKEAPDGYILNTEKMFFEILEDGQIIKSEMSNEKIIIPVPNTENNFDTLLIPIGVLMLGIVLYLLTINKKGRKK